MIPKVTVYIPCYNCEPYTRECMESVVKQEYPSMEILISDDGSTDGSLDVLREYAKKDTRITLFERGKPSGSCGDINSTLSGATGKFVCKMDADDIMADNYWETVLPYFYKPTIGWISIGLALLDEKSMLTEGVVTKPPHVCHNPIDLFETNVFFAASPFRMSMFEEVGGWDIGRPHPDWDFWIRCMLANWHWAYCFKPMYFYRVQGKSIIRTLNRESKADAMDYYRNKYKEAMDRLGLKPADRYSDKIGEPKWGKIES